MQSEKMTNPTITTAKPMMMAQALTAGRAASIPFFERRMLQCEKAKQASKNMTVRAGNAAVSGVFSTQRLT